MENKKFQEWFELNKKWLVKERTETQIGFEDTLQKAFEAGQESSLEVSK
jgi:hypothetical protein